MRDRENMRPIGTMALRYILPVMGTFFLESRVVVKRAMIWVIMVAKERCHVVRTIADRCEWLGRGMMWRIHLR